MSKHNKNFISNDYYNNTHVMSHSNKGYRFYVTIGSRGRGKTYSGKKYLLKKFIYRRQEHWCKAFRDGTRWKTVWARLTQSAVDKVLENNGTSFFEPALLRKYHVAVKVVGEYVFFADTRVKDDNGELIYHEAIRVMAISNYFNYKGNQFTEYDEVIMDELVRAKNERKMFDIAGAFKNFIENIARDREDVRCFIYANSVDEMDDLRLLFRFMPLPGKFGVYYIQVGGANATVIEYLEDSKEWRRKKQKSMAYMLGSSDDSTFTNVGAMLLDLDAIVYRHKVGKKSLVFKLNFGHIIFAVMKTAKGMYLVDLIEYTDFMFTPEPIYTLSTRTISTKVKYSDDIKKAVADLWKTGKYVYPDVKIAKQFREMLEDVKIINRK